MCIRDRSERQRTGQRADRGQWSAELPTQTHLSECRGVADLAAHPTALGRFTAGPLHGLGLALYFLLLPYVVLSKWSLAARLSNAGLIRGLLVALSLFWLLFLFQLMRNVLRLRRGLMIGGGGSAWLAGLVVAAMPFLITASSIPVPVPAQDSGFLVRAGAPTSCRAPT